MASRATPRRAATSSGAPRRWGSVRPCGSATIRSRTTAAARSPEARASRADWLPGSDRMTRNDLLIIGGGPSGLFAAAELVHVDGGVETVHPAVVIGAGGAHSVTRDSMSEPLEGATYQGHFLVADIAMQTPFPRDESRLVCGPD